MNYEFTAPVKDPAAVLDYGMDWSAWLDDGETITGTPSVVADPVGLTISAINQVEGVVSWRVSGGTAGADYIVTCGIQTSLGRADERSVRFRVGGR
jgi:hypothetical protein